MGTTLQTLSPRTPQPAAAPKPPGTGLRRHHSPLARFLLFCLIALGALYILNPTWGLWELLPDNVPLLGNLDEAGATALVIWAWREFHRKQPNA